MSKICKAITLVGIAYLGGVEVLCVGPGELGGIFTGGGMRTGIVLDEPFLPSFIRVVFR
jgi:hypothetical protein